MWSTVRESPFESHRMNAVIALFNCNAVRHALVRRGLFRSVRLRIKSNALFDLGSIDQIHDECAAWRYLAEKAATEAGAARHAAVP